ncbi:MAG TPA: hypothetical protein DCG34_08865 [Clostridiales bacterium]|nr:hypothetical protein [Clostridiales bacterium]
MNVIIKEITPELCEIISDNVNLEIPGFYADILNGSIWKIEDLRRAANIFMFDIRKENHKKIRQATFKC